jgi:hypothetical protein
VSPSEHTDNAKGGIMIIPWIQREGYDGKDGRVNSSLGTDSLTVFLPMWYKNKRTHRDGRRIIVLHCIDEAEKSQVWIQKILLLWIRPRFPNLTTPIGHWRSRD